MLLLLSLLAADAVTTVKIADRPIAAEESAAPRRSPYRLDPNVAGPADGKAAAVQVTGSQCAITGPTLCTRPPRPFYAASY